MKRALLLAVMPTAALAQIDVSDDDRIFAGPYAAQVARIVDGDTVDVRVALWPGLSGQYAIRVRGIDAPEVGRVGCDEEKAGGERATEILSEHIPPGTEILLSQVSYGTFAGRVIADITRAEDGRDIGTLLIGSGYAVAWEPGQDDVPWCLLLRGEGQ